MVGSPHRGASTNISSVGRWIARIPGLISENLSTTRLKDAPRDDSGKGLLVAELASSNRPTDGRKDLAKNRQNSGLNLGWIKRLNLS